MNWPNQFYNSSDPVLENNEWLYTLYWDKPMITDKSIGYDGQNFFLANKKPPKTLLLQVLKYFSHVYI